MGGSILRKSIMAALVVGLAAGAGAQAPCLAEGPTLIADLSDAPGSSEPMNHATVAGIDYFQAETPATGLELWRSDGTAAGTWIVADVQLGRAGSDPRTMMPGATRLYFVADTPAGETLLVSDGTAPGTIALMPLQQPFVGAVDGDVLYFIQFQELWTTDGSAAGMRLVKRLSGGTRFEDVAVVGGRVLLVVKDVATLGREIWTSDGTDAGTTLLVDLAPGTRNGLYGGLTPVGGRAYFAGSVDGLEFEPWSTDGTVAGTTLVRDVAPAGSSGPSLFTAIGSRAVFRCFDGSDSRPWITDGTPAGTFPLDGPGNEALSPGRFTVAGGVAFFQALRADDSTWLFSSDGGPGSARPVVQLAPPSYAGRAVLTGADAAGGLFYFEALDDGVLFRSDGTPAGTFPVHSGGVFVSAAPPDEATIDHGMGSVGSTLLFAGFDVAAGMELWRSDGDPSSTALVADIATNTEGSFPAWLTPAGDTLYFAAFTPATGHELWASDLTAAGTVLVADLEPGQPSSGPTHLTVAGSKLFSFPSVGGGTQLAVTDLATRATTLIDLTGGIDMLEPKETRAVGDRLVWVMDDRSNGEELWASDGTVAGTGMVADLYPGTQGSAPADLTSIGGRLVFAATTPSTGRELFVTDGTAGGTSLVADLEPGTTGSFPASLTGSVDDGVAWFVRATGGASELWSTDGTDAGTRRVLQLHRDQRYVQGDIAWSGDWLFLARNDGALGVEPWAADGVTDAMSLIADIEPGPGGSSPEQLLVDGARTWFHVLALARDHLWTTDGASVDLVAAAPAPGVIKAVTFGRGSTFLTTMGAYQAPTGFLASVAGGTLQLPLGVTGIDSTEDGGRWVAWMKGRFVLAAEDAGGLGGLELWMLTPDGDCDGVADGDDLCPENADASQQDADGDGVGDACDPDVDGDGLLAIDDCDDRDPGVILPPTEVAGLRVARVAAGGLATWDGQEATSGSAVRYDILGAPLGPWDPAAPFAAASCLGSDLTAASWLLDAAGSWWIVARADLRGAAPCGAGPTSRPELDAIACP